MTERREDERDGSPPRIPPVRVTADSEGYTPPQAYDAHLNYVPSPQAPRDPDLITELSTYDWDFQAFDMGNLQAPWTSPVVHSLPGDEGDRLHGNSSGVTFQGEYAGWSASPGGDSASINFPEEPQTQSPREGTPMSHVSGNHCSSIRENDDQVFIQDPPFYTGFESLRMEPDLVHDYPYIYDPMNTTDVSGNLVTRTNQLNLSAAEDTEEHALPESSFLTSNDVRTAYSARHLTSPYNSVGHSNMPYRPNSGNSADLASRETGANLDSEDSTTPMASASDKLLLSGPARRLNTESTLVCEYCDKVFTGKYKQGNRNRHFRAFHKLTPGDYPCTECHKTYRRKDALLKHKRKVHRIEDSPSIQNQVNIESASKSFQPDSVHGRRAPFKDVGNDEESRASRPPSSIFDADDQTKITFGSSASDVSMMPKKEIQPDIAQETYSEKPSIFPEDELEPVSEISEHRDWPAEVTNSISLHLEKHRLSYINSFVNQLSKDLEGLLSASKLWQVPFEPVDSALQRFLWKLLGESFNQSQWEISHLLYQHRSKITSLLGYNHKGSNKLIQEAKVQEHISTDQAFLNTPEPTEIKNEDSDRRFSKSPATILRWVDNVIPPGEPFQGADSFDTHPPLPLDFGNFIQKSNAYKWLLRNICGLHSLEFETPNRMCHIGGEIRDKMGEHAIGKYVNNRASQPSMKMQFHIDWDILEVFWDIIEVFFDQTCMGNSCSLLENVVCLTGSWNRSQAATVGDYFMQIWPDTGHLLIRLLEKLSSHPVGEECHYCLSSVDSPRLTARIKSKSEFVITVTADIHFILEIAEQIGWLGSALRKFPTSRGGISYFPRLVNLYVVPQRAFEGAGTIFGSCYVFFSEKSRRENLLDDSNGFCWGRLFCNPILVSGYPILRRAASESLSNTGLEISLRAMAYLVRSQQIVLWENRIIIKGFNMMLVATLVTTSMLVWHLIVSNSPTERIPYIDSVAKALAVDFPPDFTLWDIEGKRHVVGWCSKATDFCGHKAVNNNILPSGLPNSPRSIVVDRLYVEAGSQVVAGLNLCINKKDRPLWFDREKDYPSLLKDISLQPIVLYDVADRRAWLVDGASALLHLLRTSLYQDENDPESTYEWVFTSHDFKDSWDGLEGRAASLKTLKDWDNLMLKVYVKDKCPQGTVYSTLKERIEKILHCIEIIIDRQTEMGSQDGIKIPQTVDLRSRITGFDYRDIIGRQRSIFARIHHMDPRRSSWIKLLSCIGVTTIFGNGFGELIRPDDPDTMCSLWKSVPVGKEYMATSISTFRMIYTNKFQHIVPDLSTGEITKELVWTSLSEPFQSCCCLQGYVPKGRHHHNPVQILSSKSWRGFMATGKTKAIDFMNLDGKGAVVFGRSEDGNAAGCSNLAKSQDMLAIGENDSGLGTISSRESSDVQMEDSPLTLPSDSQTTVSLNTVSSGKDAGFAERSIKKLKRTWNGVIR